MPSLIFDATGHVLKPALPHLRPRDFIYTVNSPCEGSDRVLGTVITGPPQMLLGVWKSKKKKKKKKKVTWSQFRKTGGEWGGGGGGGGGVGERGLDISWTPSLTRNFLVAAAVWAGALS